MNYYRNIRIVHLLSLLLIAALGQACVQNSITSSWIDQSFKGPVNRRILVIGIFKDATTHKIFEDSFVDSLVKAGADAVPSYPYGQEEERHSKEWLHQAVQQSGAAFVLLTHLSDEQKRSIRSIPTASSWAGAVMATVLKVISLMLWN